MKTIVVSGASSGVGKTTVANMIADILPKSVVVKIGHHEAREGRPPGFYPRGTTVGTLMKEHPAASFLVIESNSILREHAPDICIYLDGIDEKPSAAFARQCANLRRGEPCAPHIVATVAKRLCVDGSVATQIAWFAGARPEPLTVAILAGGRSSRMGRDKAFMEIDGRAAIERLSGQLASRCDRLIISSSARNAALFSRFETIVDGEEDKGPLMGIASVLAVAESGLVGIVACDIPLIDPNLFPRLCAYIGEADVAVPTFDGRRLEPLLAVYRTSVLQAARKALAQGTFRVSEVFKTCRTVITGVPDRGWYFNINSPEDFERFRSLRAGDNERTAGHEFA
jgi:molybdopterin-guanine dinucleotide biosynthesis protein A